MTGRTLGYYQVLDPLGSGGMGEVYRARDTRLNRLVAIKVLRQDLVAIVSRKQRSIQEAKSASALNHPNIVTIYYLFEHEGRDYLVMEYMAGKTLGALIPRQGMRLNELRIAVQVAEGHDTGRHATVKLALRASPELLFSSSRLSRDEKWVAFHALHNATNSAQIWIAPTGPAVPAPQAEWIPITDGSKLERDRAWFDQEAFGEAFAVRHFHSARLSLRHVGSRGYITGLSVGEGALVFSMGELKGNVWMEENGR